MFIDEDVYNNLKIEEFLDHHGIKGQKWGIRNNKKETNLSRLSRIARGTAKSAGKTALHFPRTTLLVSLLGAGYINARLNMPMSDVRFDKKMERSFKKLIEARKIMDLDMLKLSDAIKHR